MRGAPIRARSRRLHFVSRREPAVRARRPRRGARALRGARAARARARGQRGRRRSRASIAAFRRRQRDPHAAPRRRRARCLPQLVARADAFFLDGFAPARNPEMWSPEVVRELARLAAPGATLATWTVAGGVRAALADAGFAVEKRAGFAGKREMLVGRARRAMRRGAAASRRAVVVGGGTRGHARRRAARRARTGTSTLVDGRARRAAPRPWAWCGRSPTCATRSTPRLSRSAFLYALQHYRALQHDGYHLAVEPLRRAAARRGRGRGGALRGDRALAGLSAGVPRVRRRATRAREIAGRRGARAGMVVSLGRVGRRPRASPSRASRAPGARVRRVSGRRVERLEREGADWRALDARRSRDRRGAGAGARQRRRCEAPAARGAPAR